MPLLLELFGGFHLFDADRSAVRVPDRRARALLAYLALAERAVPRLALAELLCPEGDEQDQRTALRQAVYVARKATAQPDLFDSVDDQIGLNEALLVSDVRRFQTAIARGDPESLSEAVELYGGPLLAGERSPSVVFEDWLSGRRSELLEQVMKALLALAEAHEAGGDHEQALALARRASTLDPLREDARRQVMRSLAALGQRAAALREYETGRQLLADELQVGPDDDTEALRDAISRGEETLANGPSALATSHRWAVACGVSPPVRADWGAPGPVSKTIDVRRAGAPWWSVAALAAVLALVTAGLAIWWYSARPQEPVTASASPAGAAVAKAVLPLPDKPSIAVLPFENLSGDERYERLADGITEDIITDLSRFRDLFVIARNSTFVYKDQPADVRQIARELGVQYVLEGSLQAEGDRVRVTAQLIDATTGNDLWSERYDRPLDDIFAIQGEVTQTIAASLGGMHGTVARAGRETARRKPAVSLEAYDYYLLGIETKHRFTREDARKAQELFRKALELDPNYSLAYVGLALSYELEVFFGWGTSWQQSMDNLREASEKAIALDPYSSEARVPLGMYYRYLNDYQRSVAEFEEAFRLNPNNADALALAAEIFVRAGKPGRALESAELAIRLNPHHPDWYYGTLSEAYFYNQRFEEAAAATRKRVVPSPMWDSLRRAISYAQLGRNDEAAREVAAIFRESPNWSAEQHLSETGTFAREVELNLFLDSVRKAGLRLCGSEEQLAKYPDIKRLEQCKAERGGEARLREVTGAAPHDAAETNPTLPLPDKPSIAVLPFENLSGDPKHERLASGITEDVITDLSRFREVFVIARDSTETYRGKPVEVRRVARELGVQFVLEGGLQIDGDQVRITAQLVDGVTGNHVWAERYDRPLDDVFVVQDEVTHKIAGTLAPSMGGVLTRVRRESARRKPPESLQAYENYLLGIEHKHRFTREDNKKAHAFLTKAIELDPGLARAYVGLSAANFVAIDNGWVTSRQEALDNALRAARTAIGLDPSDGQAHMMLGFYYTYVGDMERSLAEFEKALSLNANDADVLALSAGNMPWFGRPEQGAELADRAVRLNPNYPDWYNSSLLLAYFYAGQYDRALAVTQRRLYPDMWDYVYRPLIYAQIGRKADVEAAVSELSKHSPEYFAERWLNDTGTLSRDVELNLFLDGHRKAGLPICATEAQLAKYPDMKRLPQCEAQHAGG